MTIGAGVPSIEVATEYIEDLGLTHLGLKPGSVDAISQVIAIAIQPLFCNGLVEVVVTIPLKISINQLFRCTPRSEDVQTLFWLLVPVLVLKPIQPSQLFCNGQPIIQMYSKIRRCSNIVLVAGSGFGSDEDTYPYLSGYWSEIQLSTNAF